MSEACACVRGKWKRQISESVVRKSNRKIHRQLWKFSLPWVHKLRSNFSGTMNIVFALACATCILALSRATRFSPFHQQQSVPTPPSPFPTPLVAFPLRRFVHHGHHCKVVLFISSNLLRVCFCVLSFICIVYYLYMQLVTIMKWVWQFELFVHMHTQTWIKQTLKSFPKRAVNSPYLKKAP